jgi:ribosomal protein S18 acetylase RimI-like enzyme
MVCFSPGSVYKDRKSLHSDQRTTQLCTRKPEMAALSRRAGCCDNACIAACFKLTCELMTKPVIIRAARADEYDEIARVWMMSWTSTGLEDASEVLLTKLRTRIPLEVAKGWSLFVADDNGKIAAMLALHLSKAYLDQLFVAPEYQGRSIGRRLLEFTRQHLPDEIELRCVRENDKAWHWYEREGFAFEKEAVEPMTGFVMKYYRWKRSEQ